MSELEKRRGTLYIPSTHMRNHTSAVQHLLKEIGFVPVRVEHLYMSDQFEMAGYADAFEKVPAGNVTPEYTVEEVRSPLPLEPMGPVGDAFAAPAVLRYRVALRLVDK